MVVKHCVGVFVYDSQSRLFLMTSYKFKDPYSGEYLWIPPGGRIEDGETEEQAVHREISGEELKISITYLIKFGTRPFDPEGRFHQDDISFLFEDYAARALSTYVQPNEEIRSYGWFYEEEAMRLNISPSARKAAEEFYRRKDELIRL